MTYIAYLDEFGPYVSRDHPKHNDNPVFGLAGLVLPATEVRNFGTWFYKGKCKLLHCEISQSDEHPAKWEKKGSRLYTVKNIEKYRELRQFTNRFLNKIKDCNGFVFYVGEKKDCPDNHKSNRLYNRVLREAIKRLDQFCTKDRPSTENLLLIMDQHPQREELLTAASISMYGHDNHGRSLIEPPFQAESHRYQTSGGGLDCRSCRAYGSGLEGGWVLLGKSGFLHIFSRTL